MTPTNKEITEAINGTSTNPSERVKIWGVPTGEDFPLYTSIENAKQFEDALRSAGAFGVPTFDEGIEDIETMQDWENTHTEQGFSKPNNLNL